MRNFRSFTLKSLAKLPPMTISAVVVVVVLWLTLSPKPLPDNDINWFHGIDKLAHALMFGFLTWIGSLETYQHFSSTRRNPNKIALWWCVASSGLGIAVELAQAAMNVGRSAEIGDMIADALGAIAASFIARRWMR